MGIWSQFLLSNHRKMWNLNPKPMVFGYFHDPFHAMIPPKKKGEQFSRLDFARVNKEGDSSTGVKQLRYPICSMYGISNIFAYIWLKSMVNVGKYSIHGASGYY